MHAFAFHDHERRLVEMGGSFIAVNVSGVNLDDLLNAWRPGAIVRCFGNPSEQIRLFPADESLLGCVAGWISEDE